MATAGKRREAADAIAAENFSRGASYELGGPLAGRYRGAVDILKRHDGFSLCLIDRFRQMESGLRSAPAGVPR